MGKPPSRERYEQNNPNFTIRMPKKWHVDYKLYVTNLGLSRREFMGVSLDKIKINYINVKTQGFNEGVITGRQAGFTEGQNTGYTNGHNAGFKVGDKQGYERGLSEGKAEGLLQGRYQGDNEGYERGEKDWKIWFFCSFCGEVLFIEPDSDNHIALIHLLRYHKWGHHNCNPWGNPIW